MKLPSLPSAAHPASTSPASDPSPAGHSVAAAPRGELTRRDWIRGALAASCSLPLVGAELLAQDQPVAAEPSAGEGVPSRVVDTHTHFYDPTRPQGVPWPPRDTPLYRKVMPADWLALAAPLGITSTIVVEASQWVEDNQWVLDLAEESPAIIGLVGNLDPRDAEFEKHLKRFAKNPLYRGIRWRSDLVPIDRDGEPLVRGAKLLADLDLQLDLNGPCEALTSVARLASAVPELRIVVDHLGASGDPRSLHADWKRNIDAVASRPNVFMKVSALVEQVRCEPGQAPKDMEYYLPILDHLWASFGEDRLIYGSNWPVSDRGAPYATVYQIVRDYFATKGNEATEKYFWKNSQAAYRWRDRPS